jgi:hypothetical protein
MNRPTMQDVELRPEIVNSFPEFVKKWVSIARMTGPLNEEKIREWATKHYENSNLVMEEGFQFYFVPSPIAGATLAAKLVNDTEEPTRDQIRAQFSQSAYGNIDSPWLAYYDVFIEDGQVDVPANIVSMVELGKYVGYHWPLSGAFIASEFPMEIHLDDQNRLHCTDGPAYWYRDGVAMYFWHGVSVPDWVITTNPDTWTPEVIFGETNQEIRRAMIERYGWERFVANHKPIQFDDYGLLYHVPVDAENEEDIYVVEVENSTPEPDGTYKKYFLRVPPTVKTAREGIASTFQMSADEYVPLVET